MNEDGDIIIAGKISTHENAEIGSSLKVGAGTASGRIDFGGMVNDADGSIEVVDHEMDITAGLVRINGIDIGTLASRVSALENNTERE